MNEELARKQAELDRIRQELTDLRQLVNKHLELEDERERKPAHYPGQGVPGTDYQAGYMLGRDHGLSARQDFRGFVHGVLEGFDAGTEARKEIARDLWTKQGSNKDHGLLRIVPVDRNEEREAI